MSRCIILSLGPPPTAEHEVVEGGGLRCWGLARGMHANDPAMDVALAYHDAHRGEATDGRWEGIEVGTWRLDTIPEVLRGADSVIVSYCMGDLSRAVVDALQPEQQLVLDCYVPIPIEVSARESADRLGEYQQFAADLQDWRDVLARGDLFLCASEAQRAFYRGMLAALGRVNPITYGQPLILVVPFGVDREPPSPGATPFSDRLSNPESRKVMWFGGAYPWFDPVHLIDAVALVNDDIPCELMIVGASNPYVRNDDFARAAARLAEHAERPEISRIVHRNEWVPYAERADWYCDSDLLVLVNRPGEENKVAWRTRLADYVWAERPIATNGGDPLGESLIRRGAAARLDTGGAAALAESLRRTLGDTASLRQMTDRLREAKEELYWDRATAELTTRVADHERARDLTAGVAAAGSGQHRTLRAQLVRQSRTTMRHGAYLYRYSRQYGAGSAYQLARDRLRHRLRPTADVGDHGRLVLLAHYLDMSGAPLALADLAVEAKRSYPDVPVMMYTYPPAHSAHLRELQRAGVTTRLLRTRTEAPPLGAGDVLVMNTAMQTTEVRTHVFELLERGKLRRLVWYIHEDDPVRWFGEDERRRMAGLLQRGSMTVLIAARQLRRRYIDFFGCERGVELQPYRIRIPDTMAGARQPADFAERLRFVLSGTMGDGRKAQLAVFYAFAAFRRLHYEHHRERYRDFALVFIGVENDFLSEQVRRHAPALGPHIECHGKVDRDDALRIVAGCNVTVCYSLYECLPIFVIEGMLAGHPLLRNGSSGVEEQLEDGSNGFRLDDDDFWQVVETIERMVNRETTSDEQLAAMSARSVALAQANQADSYIGSLRADLDDIAVARARDARRR